MPPEPLITPVIVVGLFPLTVKPIGPVPVETPAEIVSEPLVPALFTITRSLPLDP